VISSVNLRDATTGLRMLQKHPDEDVLLDIDCTDVLPVGATVVSVQTIEAEAFGLVTEVAALVITSPTIGGGVRVQATYTAGTNGERYLIEAAFTTSRGDTLIEQVVLEVTKKAVS